MSAAPSGWTRIAPNYVIANPRKTVVYTGLVCNAGVVSLDIYAALPEISGLAKYIKGLLTWNILSSNVANTIHDVGSHTRFSTAGNVHESNTVSEYEFAAVTPAGTTIAQLSQILVFPVDSAGLIYAGCASGDGVNHTLNAFRVFGYFDR